MARLVAALVAGLVFGFGLALSDMVNPARVLAFLDIFGAWDPTLAFVMGGGLAVGLVAFRPTLARARPLLAGRFVVPNRNDITLPLVGGSALFGIGWGLVGYCPGPAISSMVFGEPKTFGFLAAMALGMILVRLIPQPGAPASVAA
jgi:uncharacterized membrane protein YedE/YeeE